MNNLLWYILIFSCCIIYFVATNKYCVGWRDVAKVQDEENKKAMQEMKRQHGDRI